MIEEVVYWIGRNVRALRKETELVGIGLARKEIAAYNRNRVLTVVGTPRVKAAVRCRYAGMTVKELNLALKRGKVKGRSKATTKAQKIQLLARSNHER